METRPRVTSIPLGGLRARVLGSALVLGGGFAGCGPKSIDYSTDCDNASEFSWIIHVTGGRVASGAPIEISVGETVRMAVGPGLSLNSCQDLPIATVDWQLTNPAVAALSGTRDATLQGRSPGETGVRATVRAPNGTTGSTTMLFQSTSNLIRVVP